MNASLDTDIIIHLYKSGKKDLLFSYFDELFIYEFLLEQEMKKKSSEVYDEFIKDVSLGKIKVIKNTDLIRMGIKGLFEEYVETNQYLFDRGELQAIALAKAMGIFAFVSDDTKEYGPHETLVKELIEGVMPFAFYELLFLKYLESLLTVKEMHQEFISVNDASMSERPMNFSKKISITVRRFSQKHGTKRDSNWFKGYCKSNNINLNVKMTTLKEYLSKL